jgi:hypothetical protein
VKKCAFCPVFELGFAAGALRSEDSASRYNALVKKMGTGTGLELGIQLSPQGRPEPVPIFSQARSERATGMELPALGVLGSMNGVEQLTRPAVAPFARCEFRTWRLP